MGWTVEFDRAAVRDLRKLDRTAARRILAFLHGRIAALEDPRSVGEALHGRIAALEDPRSVGEALKGSKLEEFWMYRVGDYRVIARIEDGAVRVLVVRIGNRRNVYRDSV